MEVAPRYKLLVHVIVHCLSFWTKSGVGDTANTVNYD